MKKSTILFLFISILFACKKEDENPIVEAPTCDNTFIYKDLKPAIKFTSYDSIKEVSCGRILFPKRSNRIHSMDIDQNFHSDFRFNINHYMLNSNNCDKNIELIVQGISNDYFIASELDYAIKYDLDSTINPSTWSNSAIVYKSEFDSTENHIFEGSKFIGISLKKGSTMQYGYIQLEFDNSELNITSYALNCLNNNKVFAGQKN